MKEPYGEGLGCHTDPESCGGGGNAMAEALTGVRMGRVLSRESVRVQGAHVVDVTEGNTGHIAIARYVKTLRGRRP
jgi:hypothetical protein